MRLRARSSVPEIAFSILVLWGSVVGCDGQQVVSCADPPGGQITCESNQVASCAVSKTGRVEGRCQHKPTGMEFQNVQAVEAWTISQALGKKVSTDDLKDPKYKTMLQKSRFEAYDKIVTFSIPGESLKYEEKGAEQKP